MPSTSSCRRSPSKSNGTAARGGGGARPDSGSTNAATPAAPSAATPTASTARRLGRAAALRRRSGVAGRRRRARCSVPSVVSAIVFCSSGGARTPAADRRQYGPSSATAISSSACHASCADCGRSPGALASSHSTQRRSYAGVSGASSASGGGGSWTCFVEHCHRVTPYRTACGRRASRTPSRRPRRCRCTAQRPPIACSGAMYAGVPSPCRSREVARARVDARAIPKSAIFTPPRR